MESPEALWMMPVSHMMMARFRRSSNLRPINSVKNIVDGVFLGVAAAAVTPIDIAVAINTYAGATTTVPIGAKVSSIYLFIQIISTTGTANADWFIAKANTATTLAMPVPGATGGDLNRRFILHEEKGIPGNASDGAYPLTFKGVIKLPKGRQRFGEGDFLRIFARSADIHNICVKAIYKFYQ